MNIQYIIILFIILPEADPEIIYLSILSNKALGGVVFWTDEVGEIMMLQISIYKQQEGKTKYTKEYRAID